MKKYLVPKIGNNKYGNTILVADVKRMREDSLIPINDCEDYIINKGTTVIYINGILDNTKQKLKWDYFILDNINDAIDKYISLLEVRKERELEKIKEKIEEDYKKDIEKIKKMKRLV